MSAVYILENVEQILGGRCVLSLDSLMVESGKAYALQGPNGSGKTTLLHLLAFLRAPVLGEVVFQGERVRWDARSLTALRRRVVLVEQHPVMFTDTVMKNVCYGLRKRRVPGSRQQSMAKECLDLVGMADQEHRSAHLLSGGEIQRVAIARALACQPDVLLLDEPISSVDMENAGRIECLLEDLRKKGRMTLIFSTHKPLEALRLADERIFLSGGRRVAAGGENMVSGTLYGEKGRTLFRTANGMEIGVSAQHVASGQVRLVIRPEKIRLFTLEEAIDKGMENVFEGRILQMHEENGQISLVMDMGMPLFVRTSRQWLMRAGVLPGDRIRAAWGPEAMDLLPPSS
ncbi:ATP-binding cassette domain-containing protein [Desulfobotulus sp. H1]|uniref:ATP-binding cassette domain-containing protein n=1 Tax=Desulfobotulus pelophilus TaxID=2823377 RepID=A0ABT3N7A4_9BACT|nr:ATP-binding cassette domain-containing protein [Desulfobotulus pelophilus]MCW7753337.1 ATP-binding cassette domain-containing protein [Desulfobotulus pelophilus]